VEDRRPEDSMLDDLPKLGLFQAVPMHPGRGGGPVGTYLSSTEFPCAENGVPRGGPAAESVERAIAVRSILTRICEHFESGDASLNSGEIDGILRRCDSTRVIEKDCSPLTSDDVVRVRALITDPRRAVWIGNLVAETALRRLCWETCAEEGREEIHVQTLNGKTEIRQIPVFFGLAFYRNDLMAVSRREESLAGAEVSSSGGARIALDRRRGNALASHEILALWNKGESLSANLVAVVPGPVSVCFRVPSRIADGGDFEVCRSLKLGRDGRPRLRIDTCLAVELSIGSVSSCAVVRDLAVKGEAR